MLIYFILFISICFFIASIFYLIKIKKMRATGIYPQEGMESMSDVKNLIAIGESEMATKCYRKIFSCSLKEASEAVQKLKSDANK